MIIKILKKAIPTIGAAISNSSTSTKILYGSGTVVLGVGVYFASNWFSGKSKRSELILEKTDLDKSPNDKPTSEISESESESESPTTLGDSDSDSEISADPENSQDFQ
uniref:hypothetical protein n=1 Tax=Thalassionema nitzschioides TaxID=33649 RepID=UPI001EE12C4D|nr:hypothetical protein MFU70_pgp033 [Thalassionema nitzschioides]UHY40734.1 hypothetical protein [Thalassionema nitzschioides]